MGHLIITPQGKELKAKARFTVEEANTWIKLQIKALGEHDPELFLKDMIDRYQEWWRYEDGETFEDRWTRHVSRLWLNQGRHQVANRIKELVDNPKELADSGLDPEHLHVAAEDDLITFEEWKKAALVLDPSNVIEDDT